MSDPLTSAIARRRAAGLPDDATNAWRVADGAADGLPGIQIDSFDGHWLVQTRDTAWPHGLEKSQTAHGWRSLWWKRLEQHERQPPRFMAGEAPAVVFPVRELGLSYGIDFRAGYSQGLFIDQRVQKARLLTLVQPRQRVLNLFSYTCAFSVIAASRGTVTTSVDLSRSSLDWGRRNFELNRLNPAPHYFCRGDVSDWLRRFAAKKWTWHGMVLDPPVFSRNDDRVVWRAGRDFPAITAACLRVLAPGGWLMASTNHHAMTPRRFHELLHEGAVLAGRVIARLEPGGMPPDFTGDPYLKAAWLFTDGCEIRDRKD